MIDQIDYKVRKEALDQALRHVDFNTPEDVVLRTAEAFYAFLMGGVEDTEPEPATLPEPMTKYRYFVTNRDSKYRVLSGAGPDARAEGYFGGKWLPSASLTFEFLNNEPSTREVEYADLFG
ncbi:hypothetical protein ACFWY9_28705 [Amycolatopsis sp. NPDC059027]|uniref:hypothetical protein n=1 Tax=Amycolatopsis sp. NPDC059027 TaxID=3346709 RepID=UPI00366C9D08